MALSGCLELSHAIVCLDYILSTVAFYNEKGREHPLTDQVSHTISVLGSSTMYNNQTADGTLIPLEYPKSPEF